MTAPAFAESPAKPPIPAPLLARCRWDPALYARKVLGVAPWSRQEDALRILADLARDTDGGAASKREFAIRSGNGVGKSYILACAASWWFDVVRGSCFITSPTQRQNLNLFAYLRALRLASKYALPGELLGTALRASDSWWIKLVTARSDVSFQGLHAFTADGMNRPRMLGLVEEASGVASMMWPAIRGCVTGHGDLLGMIGNPNTAAGDFALAFKDGSARTMTISALESPNVREDRDVVPGLVSRRFIETLRSRYGEDSDVYRVRVLGLPPKNDSTSIIPVSAWEAARLRGAASEERANGVPAIRGALRAGLDPGGRSDSCAFVVRDDRRVLVARKWSGESTIAIREAEAWLGENRDATLAVDGGGFGATIAEVLSEKFGSRVVTVQFGGVPLGDAEADYLQATASTERVHRYRDRRTEIWFAARDWLRDTGEVGSDLDAETLEELEADMLAPRTRPEGKGQLWMEAKDVTRKRLGRSPDLGDALALSCVADLVEEVCTAGADTSPYAASFRNVLPRTARGGYERQPPGMTAANWRRHGCESPRRPQ